MVLRGLRKLTSRTHLSLTPSLAIRCKSRTLMAMYLAKVSWDDQKMVALLAHYVNPFSTMVYGSLGFVVTFACSPTSSGSYRDPKVSNTPSSQISNSQNATTKHKTSWSVLLSRAQTRAIRYADSVPRICMQLENRSATGEWLERYTNPVYQTDTSRSLYNA